MCDYRIFRTFPIQESLYLLYIFIKFFKYFRRILFAKCYKDILIYYIDIIHIDIYILILCF